jgi:hypothetical protein
MKYIFGVYFGCFCLDRLICKSKYLLIPWTTVYSIDTKAKCRHLKKLTCKGTLRQVFIGVYRLEIQSVMMVFSTQLSELLPLSPSLWLNSPPPHPLPCMNKYTSIHVYSV